MEVKRQTGFLPNLCTNCTHLAGLFKDDMSPWVLSSIHIQRFEPTWRLSRVAKVPQHSAPNPLTAFPATAYHDHVNKTPHNIVL